MKGVLHRYISKRVEFQLRVKLTGERGTCYAEIVEYETAVFERRVKSFRIFVAGAAVC